MLIFVGMEKEIRMPYSEYEALVKQIETQKEYIDGINKRLEEKDNVLIFERAYTNWHRCNIKVLKYPSEDFKVDEIFRVNIEEKENMISNLRDDLTRSNLENIKLKSKIPWWRK